MSQALTALQTDLASAGAASVDDPQSGPAAVSPRPAKTAAPARGRGGELGARLRQRRKVRGLSLKDVASRAEVSTGLLSQIERGLTMPSVRSLGAICRALEMPVGWLFDDAGAGATAGSGDGDAGAVVIRRHARRVLDLGAKGMVKELMTPDSVTGIQMMRLVIRPGGSSGTEPYSHPAGAKCGTVLAGILGLEVEGRDYRVEAGDSFAFPATAPIRFWAEGAQDCDVLWVVSPAVY